jgi:hypothetical protein
MTIKELQEIMEYHKNDVLELESIYKYIIDNIIKVNSIFNLEDTVGIYALFTQELNNGYLSYNKEFIQKSESYLNYIPFFKMVPITGKGVCRHIVPMICYILKKSKIESSPLTIYQRPLTEEQLKRSLEEQLNNISNQIKGLDEEKIKELSKNSTHILSKPDKSEKKYGNHVISLAVQNGVLYLLDPTQCKTYKVLNQRKKLIIDKSSIISEIKWKKDTFLGSKDEMKNQKKQIKLPSITFEEEQKRIKAIESLFENNIDIFEMLYKENKDAYELANHKLSYFKRG